MTKPLVTVGLQFHNNASTLTQAILSIIHQSLEDWELILHDDGSMDGSCDIARLIQDGRISLFSDGLRKRRSARINECLRIARGTYFALMDGDDVAYPDRLARQVEYLEANRDVDLVGAQLVVFDHSGEPVGRRVFPEAHEQICARPVSGFPVAQPTFMGRTQWFRSYGYDETMDRCEDQDLLLRSCRFSRFANLPEILLGYREGRRGLAQILVDRRFLAQSLFRELGRQGRPMLAFEAVLEQAAKAGVDILADISRLHYRVLRHRASPTTVSEREDWQEVWRMVNAPTPVAATERAV